MQPFRSILHQHNDQQPHVDPHHKKASSFFKPVIQPKLSVNEPNDVYEQEADAMAGKIMRMPDHIGNDHSFFRPAVSSIQRKCATCEEEDKQLYRKENNSAQTSASSQTEDYINTLSGGKPLPEKERFFFESRMGYDFSDVRLHTDSVAATSARSINALAYTSGHNIVFNEGQYNTESDNGKRLLGHELAHVVQQSYAQGLYFDAGNNKTNTGQNMHKSNIVQRKCGASSLGTPVPDCTPSQEGSVGWQFLFKANCDELLPGEESNVAKIKAGSRLRIHGFASQEGSAIFNDNLSCHRANRIAELVRIKRTDCSVTETLKHGASPVTAPGLAPDPNPPEFWRSVIVQEVKTPPPPDKPKKAACTVPTSTPGDCMGRHQAYADAAKCFPLNSWLPCVKIASKEVCRAVEAFNLRGSEGSDLEKCIWATSGSKKFTLEKGKWFNDTNACIWGHWRNALEAINDPLAPIPSGLTPEWAQAVTTCRKEGAGSTACCEAHVIAEQSAIDTCNPYDSLVYGKLPTDVPASAVCSDLVLLATPGLPFAGDFGDVKDRISYGLLRCCSGL